MMAVSAVQNEPKILKPTQKQSTIATAMELSFENDSSKYDLPAIQAAQGMNL